MARAPHTLPIDTVEGDTRIYQLDSRFEKASGSYLERRAKSKFPKEYDEIVRRYGAVEFVLNDDMTDVVSLAIPEDYLRESDRIEVERFGRGQYGIDKAQSPLSAKGLLRLAEAFYAERIAEWERMRTDPEYLYSIIYQDAHQAAELIPDAEGNAPTSAQLLSRPAFVGWRLRYAAHNALLNIGSWAVIVEYFRDIQALDATEGRFGALGRRKALMSQVKKILDSMQGILLRQFRVAVTHEPDLRPNFLRDKTHPNYAGAVIAFLSSDDARDALKNQTSLKGALLRSQWPEDREWTRDHVLRDMTRAMSLATEEEKGRLTPAVRDAWAEVEMLSDFIVLLGTDGEDWKNYPDDERYRTHALLGRQSEPIFRASIIERYIKSAESLKSESVCTKIWAEINKVFLKRAKLPFDKVIAFAPVVPSWTHRPARPPAPSSPSPSPRPPPPPSPPPPSTAPAVTTAGEEPEQAPTADASVRAPSPRPPSPAPQPAQAASPPVPPPAQEVLPLQPSEIQHAESPTPAPPTVVVPEPVTLSPPPPEPSLPPESSLPQRKGPKVKTRGKPAAASTSENATPVVPQNAVPEVWFHVGKDLFAIFEQLLVRVEGSMNWTDFEKALTTGCGFSKVSTDGSRVVFEPQDAANTPFFAHRPHGSEMIPGLVRSLGKRLKDQYNWTIERFSPEKRKGERED